MVTVREASLEVKIMATRKIVGVVLVPDDNIGFELTLNPRETDPIKMVRADGYGSPEKWKFLGEPILTPLTKMFVHLNLGYCRNLADAEAKAVAKGYELADGRFRVAYQKKFHKPTRSIAAVFGGSGWQNPVGNRHCVPYLGVSGERWYSCLYWSVNGFPEDCRWVAFRPPAGKAGK